MTSPDGAELDVDGIPWVPRLGGRAPLSVEHDQIARTGRWDRSRYPGRSEARMAVLSAAAARGWQLADVRAASRLRGLESLPRRCTSVAQSPAGWTGSYRWNGEKQSDSHRR